MRIAWLLLAVASCALAQPRTTNVLLPPTKNLALGRKIHATSTCGEINGNPIREMYCTIAGASPYTPHSQYSYSLEDDTGKIRELKMEKQSFVQGGQNCDFCEANSSSAHPASNMVDGSPSWWQSPPLSRGMQYNEVNITIDLEQEFHVAYVWIQMANSPRPGTWVLERSTDYGFTFTPWQYFASTPAECMRLFGLESLRPIEEDDSVVCTSEFSSIHPLENGEIVLNLLENRPGRNHFTQSKVLNDFLRATNIRIRLLKTRTFTKDLNEPNDPTVTRRYYYAVKEIIMGGRCVCNGHAESCDIIDSTRPRTWQCRCEHNTCGDNCDRCCHGFDQKKWQPASEGNEFACEPCNCHGHSETCEYDEEVDKAGQSLDIHGNYVGGGVCKNCRDNTEGINCNKCVKGYYRPMGKYWNETDVCQPCVCDPTKNTGACADETGMCECLPQYTGTNCDQCAAGYYHPPECRPCECNVNGTLGALCLPLNEKCPCKPNYSGDFCQTCAAGYTNLTAGCEACDCDASGSVDQSCNVESGQCTCKSGFGGKTCETCAKGYYNHPKCDFCDCDPSGTEEDVCDQQSGQCLCKPGFAGKRCDQCDENFYGYPNCRECLCNQFGAKIQACDPVTGECPCYSNFTGRTCDKCAAGYYKYPECLACKCVSAGSKGLTCDNEGQCYCKPNFEGKRCERCKANLYNYPLCEECNCNPSGVIHGFGGCDKVAPGQLCECRENVMGRTCSQCKPTYWNLSPYNDKGCADCACNVTGTLSLLNDCDMVSGQCTCKRFVGGRACDQCADGYWNMKLGSHLGCEPCNCDVGGAIGSNCNQNSGQCQCKPRIEGLKCDTPIRDHYFPTLWHHKYEAEDGRTPDQKPVRFASDDNQFPEFSWRGFTVFSPIQDEIVLDVEVRRASVYKLMFHYHNPTEVASDVQVSIMPHDIHAADTNQTISFNLDPSTTPTTRFVSPDDKPFVLTPGRWHLHIKAKKRFFLDYIVLMPSEYYEGSTLRENVNNPCLASQDPKIPSCLDLLYPPVPVTVRLDAIDLGKFKEKDASGQEGAMVHVPIDNLPVEIGQAVFVQTGNHSKDIQVEIEVPEDGIYYMMVEYFNLQEDNLPIKVRVEQDEANVADGVLALNHCPYATFCRELVSSNGRAALVGLGASPPNAIATFTVQPGHEFGIAAVNLVKEEQWHNDLLHQVPVCVRKDGKCIGLLYPAAPNAIVTEAEAGTNVNNSIAGDKLPFVINDAENVKVMSLDDVQSTLDVSGVVATPGHYVFMVHYFNPDNTPTVVDVLVQNEKFADTMINYCPSVTGCRTVIKDKDTQQVEDKHFWIDDKYTLTFYQNVTQKGPIYIDSVTAVPFNSFKQSLLKPLPLDISQEFVDHCSADNFKNTPGKVGDYCRGKIFSLTTDFNMAALSCDCNPHGSTDFCCEEYGGQCKCKPNVIGRTCDRCAPGHYNFPDCIKCKCGLNQQCDERTGQCYCPRYVEGKVCDQCVSYAYGYDPLIGCQLCECNVNGSYGGALQCDPNNGQCLCKANVGGRRCDKCLPGFYGFPHCYECNCDGKGTTEDVCDAGNANCICKKNVIGPSCNHCKLGTFDLRQSNPDGCSDCFCFGVTDRCRSSTFSVQSTYFDDQSWKACDEKGTVTGNNGRITYGAENGVGTTNVYLSPPIDVGKDYTTSYGLRISFIVQSIPSEGNTKMSSAPDIKLVADNNKTVLEFWASEQPVDPSVPFRVDALLLPEYWLQPNGEPVTRSMLMMALLKLEKIKLKVSYYEKPKQGVIENFEMEAAAQDRRYDSPIVASSVEYCECPAPYTGPSCQYCAHGYYRVTSGDYLGSCVPCNCHGHSGTCDPDTGICTDCQHNTEGDHCERCVEGFYGNATRGGPYACLACPCPYQTPGNNFATSCEVSEYGILQKCNCKPGYTGDRCEMCDAGFFGEPERPGGKCETCFCNNNNDLSDPGACNPITGDCAQCEKNTDGRHCEYCKQWYWGDAVEAKNCTECTCDQCGAMECDNKIGECKCHPLVVGKNCDRCEENAWGFDSCHGCRECHCGIAASNTQCDLKTGQCACMSGAAGLRCEKCEHGFWDYSPTGCKKCDCEADLSMGTVCDVKTGQCHCQEGASGPRCDTCIDTYLRIPKFGCRYCDECVHALVRDLDEFDIQIEVLNTTLSNISSVALTGARLNRIQKAVSQLNPPVDTIISFASEESELKDLKKKVGSASDDASSLGIRTNRTQELLKTSEEKLKAVSQNLETLRSDAEDLRSVARWVIDSIEQLTLAFERSTPVENREELINKAKALLEEIRKVDESIDVEALGKQIDDAAEVINKVDSIKTQNKDQTDLVDSLKEKLNEATQYSAHVTSSIQNASMIINQVSELLNSLSMFALKSTISGIEKDSSAIQKTIDTQKDQNTKTTELLDFIIDANKTISGHLAELQDLRFNIMGSTEGRARLRRDVNKQKMEEKIRQLENEAARIRGIFDAAKLESKNAVAAANVYKDLLKELHNARNYTENAILTSQEAKNLAVGQKKEATDTSEEIGKLFRNITDTRKTFVNELNGKKKKIDERLESLKEELEKQGAELDAAKISFELENDHLQETGKVADEVVERMQVINDSLKAKAPEIAKITERVSALSSAKIEQSIEGAKSQLTQVQESIPGMTDALREAQEKWAKNDEIVAECKSKIAALKERIAVVRDKANMIKLGAHFEPGSSLQLPITQKPAEVALTTDIKFFFRTKRDNGLLFFYGNDQTNPRAGSEYIAIEIQDKRPKFTMNFGKTPVHGILDTIVADHHWRELIVERIGNVATFKVTKPRDEAIATETVVASDGPKSLLNLYEDSQKLFVGGVPPGFSTPGSVREKYYVGDIDKLRINGELIGFWNSENATQISGAEMRTQLDSERSHEVGMSFKGTGYMQLGVGSWNPRKRTSILLSFMTYSPDGLLFFVGKDRDQLVLEISEGHVSLSFDLGSGVGKLVSKGENYNDGKWHMVNINRIERQAKLEIDGSDIVEGESPGTMFEMSVSDSFYLGGLPHNVETRFTVQPFRGCLKNLKIDTDYVNLNKPKAAKGVQQSCSSTQVRVVSLISERAQAKLTGLNASSEVDVSFRFRTQEGIAHLISVTASDSEEIVRVDLDKGHIIVRSNGDEYDQIDVELSSASDGNWHYVNVIRSKTELRVNLDDYVSKKIKASDLSDVLPSDDIHVTLGRRDNGHFIGCVGDVIFNGKLMNFASYTVKEVKLTGCTMSEAETTEALTTSTQRSTPEDTEEQEETPKEERPPSPSIPVGGVRPPGSCALPELPYGEREDSIGMRFGLQPGSRIEYDKPPDSFDRNVVFSLQLRATASNGIIMFASNDKHSDFMALYMLNGKINFAFGSGAGTGASSGLSLALEGQRSLLDNEWHTVRVEREGSSATLTIDDQQEANNRTEGIETLEISPPIYIGGLPTDLLPFASRVFPGVKSEFGGCLREFKLNDKKFADEGRMHGVVNCSQYNENGMYFSKNGGYAILHPQFVVGSSFSLEMEVKSRTKNAVLLSVGVLEYLTLQILNGTIKFSVDNGAGVESVIYSPPANNMLCDGHWHQIKLYKKKNLMTLNVDGKSNLKIMKKKGSTETNTKDPLYLGGVPKDVRPMGLDTTESYVGCVRIISIGKKQRKRRELVDLNNIVLFGNVHKNTCPVN